MNSYLFRLFLLYFFAFSDCTSAQTIVKVENYMKQATTHAQQGAASYGKYLFHFTELSQVNIHSSSD